MSFNLKKLFFVFLVLICSSNLFAQKPEEAVKKDFPKLYSKYGNKLKQQKARYVFAIDISNSMKPYESAVKSNIKNFISALPEGDFVSIIQKCGTSETDFIFSNQPVNSTTKTTIFNYIDQIKFDKNGSDGYRMTDKIIEALNQTGSSEDMKYVFMFTDFEYWTSKNQFNKKSENWKSLKTKFEQTQKGNFVSVTGLRLALSQGVKLSAVYENELKDIFGKVDILPSPNPVFLATWFNNTKANILRDRLSYVITKLAKKENQEILLSTKSENGKPSIVLSNNSIFQKVTLTDASLKEVIDIYNSRPLIGPFSLEPKIIEVDATLSSPDYNNDKGNEVEKIIIPSISNHSIEVFQGPGYMPWYIGWPLVVLLVIWFLSVIHQLLTFKTKRNWMVGVKIFEADDFSSDLGNQNYNDLAKIEIGNSANQYKIEGCGFDIVFAIRKNVFFPFFKSGYFLIKKSSVGKMNYNLSGKTEIANEKETFLCKQSKFKGCKIEVIRMDIKYIIRIV